MVRGHNVHFKRNTDIIMHFAHFSNTLYRKKYLASDADPRKGFDFFHLWLYVRTFPSRKIDDHEQSWVKAPATLSI